MVRSEFFSIKNSVVFNFIVRFGTMLLRNKQNLQAQSDAVLAIKKVFDATISTPAPLSALWSSNVANGWHGSFHQKRVDSHL
jgi:hypothetical protein